MLLFVVNLGHDEVKIIKGHTLAYLTPIQYDNFSEVEEINQESKIADISAAHVGTKAEIFPANPSDSKMIFPGDDTPIRKVLLQDAIILVETQEKWNSQIHTFEDMSLSSNDIGYTKLIEMGRN